ncbi:MAG: hypothetical protein IPO09_15375 [Anaeromyxobacter sp.]|nr:hypothetical protein [Anaeromyxobacter sp.]
MKLPHIGWSPVRAAGPLHPRLRPRSTAYVYFAHSYAAPAEAPGVRLLLSTACRTAPAWRAATCSRRQFHPEKSQQVGLAFLRRFVEV